MPTLLNYGTGAGSYVLDRGVECTLVNAATATGVGFSAVFSLYAVGWDHTLLFQAIGTFTVCTADLEVSSDGGTTFVALIAGNDFNANRVLKSLNLTPGNLYRWNIKTFTGTSVTINGTSS
jgi:hypothetical protein